MEPIERPTQPVKPRARVSRSGDAARRELIERARARTPYERILLALELGARDRAIAEAFARR